jgi:hypothetical protein
MKPPGTDAGSGSISRLAPQFADRQPRIPPPSTSNAPNSQNSNRECFRLETAVTQRKERTQASSNREIGALFSSPTRPKARHQQIAHLKILIAAKPKQRKTRTRDPQLLFRIGKIRSLIPLNLRRNLIEPMFRVDRAAKRRKIKARAKLAHGDASRGKEEKPNSRPPTFVAIKKNYVIGFIRLKEAF